VIGRALDWLRGHRDAGRWVAVGLVAVVGLVLLARTADTADLPDYEAPEGFEPAPAPTTAPPGAAWPDLEGVAGTTTSAVPPNTGRARLNGTVTGPSGPVVGAVVRVERVVAGTTQTVDVATGPDGRYDLPNIGGGRYRLRAFLAPTLAQAQGTVFFLRADEDRVVDLTVDAYAEPSISLAFAPDPPLLDQAVNVAVAVRGRLVDPDGFVRTQPLVGGSVSVSVTSGWVPRSATTTSTDGNGEARFAFECRSTGTVQLTVTARIPTPVTTAPPQDPGASTTTGTTAPAVPTSTTATFDVPACVDPATLTTTTTEPPATSTTDGSTSTTTGDTTTSTAG
jgi:hypothetical protein